ncbi:uncharacterized protein DSM5745_03970 [Aspergillus mulundensis]|uniref:ribonuclease H n=1 Tax=Aspergillus mulundensis TaxID=1810919 RepID=A0A3D8SC37_9EURO|nr:hypothetical protein DSM5745_03970 [Aspergillus mulundensis]RDW83644.1 hypothetical protein DSM5745_03970 [Aspergillus mulundensis]
MPYKMEIFTDGGCRNNGQPGATGAAAAVFQFLNRTQTLTRYLSEAESPTSQRAELTGIIIALEEALRKYNRLYFYPYLQVTIYSDSQYAVRCMTVWRATWVQNGWRNSNGDPVANTDLLWEALQLQEEIEKNGVVHYAWIPRTQNTMADAAVNQRLDQRY